MARLIRNCLLDLAISTRIGFDDHDYEQGKRSEFTTNEYALRTQRS